MAAIIAAKIHSMDEGMWTRKTYTFDSKTMSMNMLHNSLRSFQAFHQTLNLLQES